MKFDFNDIPIGPILMWGGLIAIFGGLIYVISRPIPKDIINIINTPVPSGWNNEMLTYSGAQGFNSYILTDNHGQQFLVTVYRNCISTIPYTTPKSLDVVEKSK